MAEPRRNLFDNDNIRWPYWTVLYNINCGDWVGTGWEFYDEEFTADLAYGKHIKLGNCPCKRPFHLKTDREHLGMAHRNGRIRK